MSCAGIPGSFSCTIHTPPFHIFPIIIVSKSPGSYSRWRPHPWHGLEPGPEAPRIVNAFIEITAVFGDLAHQHRFVEAYRWALDSLHNKGARATLEALVQ